MTSIAVAMATFNGQAHLQAQLASLAVQTSLPAELVVADDGSSDDTVRLLTEFSERAPFPMRVIQNRTRLGYAGNFMVAAAACESDLIAFCDQDDVWEPTKLAVMRKPFHDPGVLVAFHNSSLMDKDSVVTGTTHPRRVRSRTFEPLTIDPWMIVPGHAQVVRRSLNRFTPLHTESVDPYGPDRRMPHDHWYLFWASVLGTTAYVAERLVRYRQHGANASGWPHPNWAAYIRDNIEHAEEYTRATVIGARNRLTVLERSGDLLTPGERDRVEAAMPWHQALLGKCDRRLGIYVGRTLMERARALLTSIAHGAYTTRSSLGLQALLLDAFIGVPFRNVGRG